MLRLFRLIYQTGAFLWSRWIIALRKAKKAKDDKAVKEAEKEKAKRQKKDASDRDEEVCLPKIKGGALMRIFG